MRNDIATNGPDGFQMDELNFAEQNINSAQDQTQATKDAKIQLAKNEGYIRDQLKKEGFNDSDITKKLNEMGPSEINQLGNRISEANQMLKDRELLAKENFTEDEINGMTPEEIAEKAAKIRQDQVSIFDNFADAGVALGGLLMSGGAIAFGLTTGNFPNTNPNAPQNPIPTPPVATEPKPTRKEEEGEEGESIEGGETLFDASEDDTVGNELNEDSSNLVADNKDSLDQRPEFLKEIMGDYYDPRMDTDYTRPTNGEVETLKPGEKSSLAKETKTDRQVVDSEDSKPSKGEWLGTGDYSNAKRKILDAYYGDGPIGSGKKALEEAMKDPNLSPVEKANLKKWFDAETKSGNFKVRKELYNAGDTLPPSKAETALIKAGEYYQKNVDDIQKNWANDENPEFRDAMNELASITFNKGDKAGEKFLKEKLEDPNVDPIQKIKLYEVYTNLIQPLGKYSDKDTLTGLKNKYPMGEKNNNANSTRPLSISEHIWGSFEDPGQPIKGLNLSESRASILDRFPERELSEIYILKDRSKAEEYIKNGNYDEQTKKKLTTELDRMQNEWRENEKTEEGRIKNRNVEAAFKGYDVIQYEGRLPVYRNQNGAILPFPIINSDFGPRDVTDSGVHNGLDFPVPIGTPVPVVYSGTVIKSNYSESWGNYVVVKSEDGYHVYAHLSSSDVKVGDQVNQGSQLGRSGNSGFFIKDGVSQQVGAHFHFGVFTDENLEKPVDPKGSE